MRTQPQFPSNSFHKTQFLMPHFQSLIRTFAATPAPQSTRHSQVLPGCQAWVSPPRSRPRHSRSGQFPGRDRWHRSSSCSAPPSSSSTHCMPLSGLSPVVGRQVTDVIRSPYNVRIINNMKLH